FRHRRLGQLGLRGVEGVLVLLLLLLQLRPRLLKGVELGGQVLGRLQRLHVVLALGRRLHLLLPRGDFLLHRRQLGRLRLRRLLQPRLQRRQRVLVGLFLLLELLELLLVGVQLGLQVGQRLVGAGVVARVRRRVHLPPLLLDR